MVVASVQNAVYIPVFSDYFSSPAVIETVVESDKPYITSIKVEITEFEDGPSHIKKKGIYIRKINVNENFSNFINVIVTLTNISTDETLYSGPKTREDLNNFDVLGCIAFDWTVSEGSASFKLNIYCSSLNPENIDYESSITREDGTYYLIYTHKELIKV